MQPKEHPRYDLALLIGFLLIVAALGISPRSRMDWILKNLLALLLVLVLRSLATSAMFPLESGVSDEVFEGATTLPDGRPPPPTYTQINMLLIAEHTARRRL